MQIYFLYCLQTLNLKSENRQLCKFFFDKIGFSLICDWALDRDDISEYSSSLRLCRSPVNFINVKRANVVFSSNVYAWRQKFVQKMREKNIDEIDTTWKNYLESKGKTFDIKSKRRIDGDVIQE